MKPETDTQFLARMILEMNPGLPGIIATDEARLRALAEYGPGPVPNDEGAGEQ
jgi:hypothetical protein